MKQQMGTTPVAPQPTFAGSKVDWKAWRGIFFLNDTTSPMNLLLDDQFLSHTQEDPKKEAW